MKSTFTPPADEVVPEPTEVAATPVPAASPEPSLAPAAAPAKTEVVANDFFKNENVEGEYDEHDLVIPGLNLVQGVGPLSEHFTPGQMVYNKEEVLEVPVELTLLRMKKYLLEKLPYGSDVKPRRFNTQQEARNAGLVPPWEKQSDSDPVFEQILETQVLLGGDPAKHPNWMFEFNGKVYTLARYILKSIAFSETGKMFISAAQFGLRSGLHTGYWHITPKREKRGANFIWLPKAKLAGKHSPEFVAWVADKMK